MINRLYSKKNLVIFLLLQPLIDVFTNVSTNNLNFSLGITVRGLFIMYAFIYLFFIDKNNKKSNYTLCLISMLFLMPFILDEIGCFNILIAKLPILFKILYFPICTLFLYRFQNNNNYKHVTINAFLISILMILAQLFGGAILSYGSGKFGNSGWFFSANELSSICSIIIPIVFGNFVSNNNKFALITFIMLSISMLLIGTKTAYLSILLTLLMFFIYLIYKVFIKKEERKRKVIYTFALLLIFLLITPLTYTYKNIKIFDKGKNESKIILNGREEILDENLKEMHKKDGIRLIDLVDNGLGSEQAFYEFERDYHNIYYNFGLFGFIVFFTVPLYIFIVNIKKIEINISIKKFGFLISLLLGFGIAFISGHTLLSPAVSIYLAISFSNLFYFEKSDKKKLMFISSVGGHLTQMLELKNIFKDYNYILVTEKTQVTKGLKKKYNISFLNYGSRKYLLKYIFISLTNVVKSIYIFVKNGPEVIVTTGTHTAVPMCYIGWICGKKIIYIESFAKRTSPTLAGRIIYPVATTFVVQWETMLKYYPKAQYWGGIY